MIDPRLLREEPDRVRAAQAKRGEAGAPSRLTSLRVYLVRPDDIAIVRQRLHERYGEITDLEFA